jgi:hypothetical protein
LVVPADVADARAIFDAADAIVAEFGAIDIWINDTMVTGMSTLKAILGNMVAPAFLDRYLARNGRFGIEVPARPTPAEAPVMTTVFYCKSGTGRDTAGRFDLQRSTRRPHAGSLD